MVAQMKLYNNENRIFFQKVISCKLHACSLSRGCGGRDRMVV
jgi:hypothetical protein